jgi:hypothetical protein
MTHDAQLKRDARNKVFKHLRALGHPSHIARQLADKAVTVGMANAKAKIAA